MNNFFWPLMYENIEKIDLECLITFLSDDKPKLTNGMKVREFEVAWSDWLGVDESVMVNSGSSANDLTLLALKEIVGLGEIILPPLTWVSDVSAVLRAGFTPVFADILLSTLSLDPECIMGKITPKTKAVFLTHVLGFDGTSDYLLNELKRLNIPLIEDVCESHGATHQGKKLGTLSLASNFSFYYGHHMTTIEGGMISSNNSEFMDIVRMMRAHGLVRESRKSETREHYAKEYPSLNQDFVFAYASHNMRPTELNGILGLSQLPRLDLNIGLRTRNFDNFVSNLDGQRFFTKFKDEGSSNFALPLVLNEKDTFLQKRIEFFLKENNIEFRRGLAGGGNQLRQPYLRGHVGQVPEDFPVTEHIHFYSLYIGNYPQLEFEKIEWLCNSLNEI